MNGFLIAAPQSGSGKTTVSLAIMAALVAARADRWRPSSADRILSIPAITGW